MGCKTINLFRPEARKKKSVFKLEIERKTIKLTDFLTPSFANVKLTQISSYQGVMG